MGSRTWIKVYCDKWLEGTISTEAIHVRGIWITLLALAGNGRYGDSGQVMAIEGVGFNDKQLAAMLKISVQMWAGAKSRLLETGRIEVTAGNIISIVNWLKYQSEYERTSKYRTKSTTTATPKGTPREERIEKRERDIYIVPDFIDEELWSDFIDMRGKLRKPPTDKAKALLVKDLEKHKGNGDDPNEILRQSIKNSWLGLFPLRGDGKKTKPLPTTEQLKEGWDT